jgi:hypothetical protein
VPRLARPRLAAPRLACRLLALAVLALLLFAPGLARGQDEAAEAAAPPDTLGQWATDATGKLALSQAAFRNWREGGISTIAVTSGVTGKATRTTSNWSQRYEGRLAFGLVQQDTLAVRKSEDVIRLALALRYRGDGFFRLFNPTVAADVRTQFASGFDFEDNPFPEGTPQNPVGVEGPVPVETSAFFAPAILQQSLGLTYEPAPWFIQRVGFATKETVVALERLQVLYGNAEVVEGPGGEARIVNGQIARFEAGAEAVSQLDREIFTNVRLQSTLSLFAAVNQANRPDVYFENLVTLKVNAWLSTNLELVTIYDTNISRELQLKQVLSVGLSFVLI